MGVGGGVRLEERLVSRHPVLLDFRSPDEVHRTICEKPGLRLVNIYSPSKCNEVKYERAPRILTRYSITALIHLTIFNYVTR